jgi:hypothetical protein
MALMNKQQIRKLTERWPNLEFINIGYCLCAADENHIIVFTGNNSLLPHKYKNFDTKSMAL